MPKDSRVGGREGKVDVAKGEVLTYPNPGEKNERRREQAGGSEFV